MKTYTVYCKGRDPIRFEADGYEYKNHDKYGEIIEFFNIEFIANEPDAVPIGFYERNEIQGIIPGATGGEINNDENIDP